MDAAVAISLRCGSVCFCQQQDPRCLLDRGDFLSASLAALDAQRG